MRKYFLLFILLAVVIVSGCGSNKTSETSKASEAFVIKEINLELIKCQAGEFKMGSSKEEEQATGVFMSNDDYKDTLHLVTIKNVFFIGKYEVTQSQYTTLMGKNPSNFIGDNKPVDSVSYDDAIAFCDKLNLKYAKIIPQGYKFDLPTEEQWEYACRAGTTTALNNGKNLSNGFGACPNLDEVAWYADNSKYETHPVGLKKPNAWGIYDMHGNVEEFCKGCGYYPSDLYNDSEKDVASRAFRITRGGSWDDFSNICRSAHFCSIPLDSHDFPKSFLTRIGFRVALVPIE